MFFYFYYDFTNFNTEYGKYTVNKQEKKKEDVYFISVEDPSSIDKK